MGQPIPLSTKFRHVVFPAEARRRQKVLNLTAAGEIPAAPAERETPLSLETAAFLRWLFRQAGLEVRAYRPETLRRRLPACLRALGARSLAHARQLLEQTPTLVEVALSAMLVGVTAFFRDPLVFAFLREQVLPKATLQRKGFYVWSIGCSDGAELYSIGILFAELDLLAHSYLLGSDCRTDAIQRARLGCFDAAALKNVSPERRGRYFTPRGPSAWQVQPFLRIALRWRSADILSVEEPGIWDLILCRNTTMYMRTEYTTPLWSRLEAALRPGGVLIVGKAERPAGVKRLSLISPGIYQRMRG
jgi:chemotaxis methyl-accepting protein methylase